MFKQTSNYLNSISNLQGVPFFAALTPDLPPFFSALRLHIYIYTFVFFLLFRGPSHHSFRVLEDVVGSSRVKSTRDTSRFCSLLFLFMSRTAPLKRALANSPGLRHVFPIGIGRREIFLFFNKILFQFYRR